MTSDCVATRIRGTLRRERCHYPKRIVLAGIGIPKAGSKAKGGPKGPQGQGTTKNKTISIYRKQETHNDRACDINIHNTQTFKQTSARRHPWDITATPVEQLKRSKDSILL